MQARACWKGNIMIIRDNEVRVFNDSYEMEQYMSQFESDWITGYPVRQLKFSSPSSDGTMTREVADTLVNGTKLLVELNNTVYGVRECAMQSMFRRCGIAGEALNNVKKQDLAEILNTCAATRTGNTMISVVNGKISAFLSDDGNKLNYSILPSAEVFRMTEERIAMMVGDDPDSFYGVWKYDGIHCRWKLPIKKDLDGQDYAVQLSLSTSDVGLSAITYSAALVGNGKTIPIVSPTAVQHRLASQADDVCQVLDMMEAMIDDSINNLTRMENIIVTNPVNTMRRVMKFVKLPKGLSTKVIASYEKTYSGGSDTAKNLYLKIADVVNVYARSQKNMRYQNVVRNNVLKVQGLDWSKFDLPGTFSW